MSETVISVENLYKEYKLGVISHGTLYKDLQSWWARVRGKEDPNSLISAHHSSDVEAGSFLALNDVSFEVKEGEILGIIGKNGAGKSTLLKILSRITSPTKGQIKTKGRVGSLLEVGTGFHPELTGRENIYLNGAILGMKKWEIDKKLDEIIDFAGIERHIDTPVKRYSSGMYVRLAFSVAAHLEPNILVVDEVLAVGDVEFQKKALGKMEDVSKREGRTILFVSHNMAAVQQLCQKGIILSKGQLIYSGTILESVNKYINNLEYNNKFDNDGFIDLDNVREKEYLENIFKRIRILDRNNKPCNTFPMLSSMTVEIELKNNNYINADYGIYIFASNGQRLTSFATWMYEKNKLNHVNKILLKISSIKYSPGKYFIGINSTFHTAGEWIDRIDNAVSFYVEPVDIFGTGREFSSGYGLIIPEGELLLL